jgi:hypothetical protein
MFCNYCGAPNPDDAAFCSACGKRVARVEPAAAPSGEPVHEEARAAAPSDTAPAAAPAVGRRRAGALMAWTVMLVLIGAIGAGGALQLSDEQQDSSGPSPVTSSETSSTPSTPDTTTSVETTTSIETTTSVPAPLPAAAEAASPVATGPPSIVGEWKTSLLVGEGTLTLTADGHCHVKNLLADDSGIYTYSPLDGELRIQVDSFFNHDIIRWHAQLSPDGESLTVQEPEGAAHVYHRVHE